MNDQTTGMTKTTDMLTGPFASLGEAAAPQAHDLRPRQKRGGSFSLQTRGHGSLVRRLIGVLTACAFACAAPAAAAAATPSPGWTITSVGQPTNFSADDNANCTSTLGQSGGPACDSYVLTATNAGSQPTDGSPVTLTDAVPAGLTVQQISFIWHGTGAQSVGLDGVDLGFLCTTAPLQCQLPTAAYGLPPIAPNDTLQMIVYTTVDSGASGTLTNTATVSGGGAPGASWPPPTCSTQNPPPSGCSNQISSTPAPFGLAQFNINVAGVDGAPDRQAGDHPYQLTTSFDLTTAARESQGPPGAGPPGAVKDTVVDLPLGLVGDPQAAPRCTLVELQGGACPAASEIGLVTYYFGTKRDQFPGTIYNLVPEAGHPAEFGFVAQGGVLVPLYGDVVPTTAGYALRVTVTGLVRQGASGSGNPGGADLTFFGDPAAENGSGAPPAAFFTMPTDCSAGPLTVAIHADSWEHPGALNPDGSPDFSDPNWKTATQTLPPVTGCDKLQFQPTLTARPDTTVADSPAGLSVDLKVPQAPNLPGNLATPELRNAVVTLPAGVSVSPSAANGLAACTPAEIGLGNASEPTCPDASKIGTVEVDTPLLDVPLKGAIYVAQQGNNPFGSLLAIYVTAEADGALIKLAGHVVPDPVTGQLQTTFDNNPELPFSEFKLDFFGGPRGALATPESCGTFTTTSQLTPWSAPDSGPDSTPSDPFQISSGCVSGFAPTFTAGTTNPQAGAFSPFVLSFSRSDTDQNLSGLSVKLPPGMLAKLAGVQLCSDQALASISSQPGTGAAQAATPSCPSGSQVGTVQTGAGVGPSPLFLGGKAYLTGPYKGAPYGLAVVVPALAGPFDLGSVVVRQALYVDPTTAQVTAVSDPFPTILDGIPLRLRRVDVSLDRPNFTVNPTSCAPMAVTGALTSVGGLAAPVSSRFQVGGCQELAFTPKLKLVLSGKGQTTDGKHPGVRATVTQTSGQANVRSAQVALPLSLALDPANTQHVCDYDAALAVHGGSTAACPKNTIVGTATAVTPLLDHPLTAYVYLVQGIRFNSHGQRIKTLPTLLIPLRGQIALDLRAQSSVDKANHLVTTFPMIPDAAIQSFDLTINGGKQGILVVTHGANVCKGNQTATGNFSGQNGKTAPVNTPLSAPCPKPAVAGLSQSANKWRENNKLAQITKKKKPKKQPPVGTTFGFSLNEPAAVRLDFTQRAAGRKVSKKCVPVSKKNRKKPKCARTVIAGTLAFNAHTGANRVRFAGRLSATKKLTPGRYTLTITATSAGLRSTPRSLSFTIVKG
jgi:Domain of unknown function DUF11